MERAITNDSLVLFSGGMDSTISLYHRLVIAKREGVRVNALTFLYGQRHVSEASHAADIIQMVRDDPRYTDAFGVHVVTKMHLPRFEGSLLGRDSVTKYETIEDAKENGETDNSFIPYRNLIMLAIAAAHAYKLNARILSTGLRGGFPDCTAEFEKSVADMLFLTVPDFPIVFDTPTHATREACLRYAQTLPGCMEAMALTLTCFEGAEKPCGHCLPCLKRAEGFKAIGIRDPIL